MSNTGNIDQSGGLGGNGVNFVNPNYQSNFTSTSFGGENGGDGFIIWIEDQ